MGVGPSIQGNIDMGAVAHPWHVDPSAFMRANVRVSVEKRSGPQPCPEHSSMRCWVTDEE